MTFPSYQEYKDSSGEWIGAIPAHWSVSPLKRGFMIEGGSTPPPDEINWDGDIAWVTPADLSGLTSFFLDTSKRTITDTGLASCGTSLLPAGSLILSTRAPIGSLAIALIRMCTNQGCKGLIPNESAFSTYFAYVLLTAKTELNIRGKGTTFLEISGDELGRFDVPMPPLSEQTQIARFLDHETARIDALIEEQKRLIELLKEKRQAVISHAVTKGLDPTVPMKDSGVEWLGEVPAHWGKKRLKNISPFITVGIVVNPSDYVSDEGLPFLYGGEVKEGFIEVDKARKISPEDSKKNRKTMLETGDIVTMRVGYPGLTAVVPPECAGGNCASVMLVKRGNYDSHWLCAVMNSRLVRQQVEVVQYGAAQKQFNIADAIEFWMFEPPREEQTTISEFIDRQSSVFNALMEESEGSMQLLKERRSALISAAVTGKIDVRGWQPPASTQAPESVVAEAS
ncbi:restriction endonuclease subunit S [Pseudomonas sp. GD03944]|uniref:restriction endonuclease subunit S n=1 Tax=Pseudomonas sp. GD03944 TaxID=2975409 RepID=UPI00244C819D|nr:restriction endonuclease subunit S [Pseudomonas sp. GD03944]MDH1261349.1 restriction endonuclease subunit S [Pseudomonas sp. GD03944]